MSPLIPRPWCWPTKGRNAALAVASLACLALAGCSLLAGHPEASCAAPMIEIEPHRAPPGGAVRVYGEAFGRGCDDVGPVLESSEPLRGVRLVFRQDSRNWTLANVDADLRLSFDARVRVPEDAELGRAAVRAVWATKDPESMPEDHVRVLAR